MRKSPGIKQPRYRREPTVREGFRRSPTGGIPLQYLPKRRQRDYETRAIAPSDGDQGMKAVGYRKSLPIDDAEALFDFETAKPEPRGRDIRVAVKAISANPVDLQGAQARRAAGRRDQDPRLRRRRHRRCRRPGRDPVQARRRGLLRRLDPAPGHQLGISSGRRAHRRAQAENACRSRRPRRCR